MFNYDDETYAEAAVEALAYPSDAYFHDEDLYVTHTLMFHTPDPALTDEYAYGYSNYRSILRDYAGEDVEAASVGHWTYSRFLCLKVRVIDDSGQVTDTFRELYDIARGLDDYPIYDESDYYDLESELQDEYVQRYAEDEGIPVAAFWEALSTDRLQIDGAPGDFVFYVDSQYGMDWREREAKVREIALEALRSVITLEDHASGTAMHYPEYCFACERAAV
jgi:hypothetical protein